MEIRYLIKEWWGWRWCQYGYPP